MSKQEHRICRKETGEKQGGGGCDCGGEGFFFFFLKGLGAHRSPLVVIVEGVFFPFSDLPYC